MSTNVKMVSSYVLGGLIGWTDSYNCAYSVHAKMSNWATPEQNGKLEAKLLEVYRDYLEEVAKNNNGLY